MSNITNLLDSRFIRTSEHLQKFANPIILTQGDDYISLEPQQTAVFRSEDTIGSTGIEIPINTQEGCYKLDLLINGDSSVTHWDFQFYPNNINYGNVFKHTHIFMWQTSTDFSVRSFFSPTRSPLMQFQYAYDTTNTDHPPITCSLLISTITTRKQVIAYGGEYKGYTFTSYVWNDTTTPWTKLGKILFPYITTKTFSARCYITRIF